MWYITVIHTSAVHFEWGSDDVVIIIFYADVVIAWSERCIPHLITFLYFRAIHGYLAGAINGNSKGTRTSIYGVYYKVGLNT